MWGLCRISETKEALLGRMFTQSPISDERGSYVEGQVRRGGASLLLLLNWTRAWEPSPEVAVRFRLLKDGENFSGYFFPVCHISIHCWC